MLTIIAVLPVLTAISLYSIGIRIHEYGFTPFRILLLIGVIITALFSIAYSVLIVSRKLDRYFGKTNLTLILLTALVVLLLATPVLDIRRISANSQMTRLLEAPKDGFDIDDLQCFSSYGYYGVEALNQIKDRPAFVGYQEDIEKILSKPIEKPPVKPLTDAEKFTALKTVMVYPTGTILDDDIYQTIVEQGWLAEYYTDRLTDDVVFLMVDINRDQQAELVMMTSNVYRVLYNTDDHRWVNIAIGYYHPNDVNIDHFKERLAAGDFSGIEPPLPVLQNLKIGERVFSATICCEGYDIIDTLSTIEIANQ
jgi:hypothetical protein